MIDAARAAEDLAVAFDTVADYVAAAMRASRPAWRITGCLRDGGDGSGAVARLPEHPNKPLAKFQLGIDDQDISHTMLTCRGDGAFHGFIAAQLAANYAT
jgi:hypothetical protein